MAVRYRRRREEPENHERWLVSYADFITLLFAFFVVMYSISSVNEGKMRVLSDSLVANFSDRSRSLDPIQVGELVRSPAREEPEAASKPVVRPPSLPLAVETVGSESALLAPPEDAPPADETSEHMSPDPPVDAHDVDEPPLADSPPGGQDRGLPMADAVAMAEEVSAGLAELIDQGLVSVRREDRWIEVELSTNVLFESGEARLAREAVPVLADVSEVLKRFPNPIQVEGFTDNIPISTVAFPSNWELSAARSASVVNLFMRYGVRPDRMVAIGYGEHRPLLPNDTPEGRSRNRRVVLVIPAEEDVRPMLDLERMREDAGSPDVAGSEPSNSASPAPEL